MKEIHRNREEARTSRRDRRAVDQDEMRVYRKRDQAVRRRRLLGAAALALLLLGGAALAYYLVLGGGDNTQPSGTDETATSEEAPAADEGAVSAGDEEVTGTAASGAPGVLLGEFFTDYAWDPDEGRQSNLRAASGAIDETVLAPGEEFSALEVLSPLEYEPAKVFANGGVDYEVGGGLCQVSSTLYMAANYAGLEIVERNPHYAELPYIRPGLDATVWFGQEGASGALDMRFKNDTDGDILIREFVNEDGFLVAEIYGDEPSGRTVSMTSEKVREDLGRGIDWATYKTATDDETGETLEDGLLFETTYSYNPPVPEEFKHETNEPRGSGWVDLTNTTNWNDKDG